MTLPYPFPTMTGTNAWQQRNVPVTLTSMTLRHVVGEMSVKGPISRVEKMAALLTRISTVPRSPAIRSLAEVTSSSEATSTA